VHFECADVEPFVTEERFDTHLMIGVLHHTLNLAPRSHAWKDGSRRPVASSSTGLGEAIR
jgi:hypothetical protein